jgi:hypothetical protein
MALFADYEKRASLAALHRRVEQARDSLVQATATFVDAYQASDAADKAVCEAAVADIRASLAPAALAAAVQAERDKRKAV